MATNKIHLNFSGHSDTINDAFFSYAERSLITGSSDRTIRQWDFQKGFSNKTYNCSSSCFCLDSQHSENMFVSGHFDNALRFWSIRADKQVHLIENYHTDAITSVNFTRNEHLLLTLSRDHTAKLLDVRTYQCIDTFEHDLFVNSSNTLRASISANGKYGVFGSRNGTVLIVNISQAGIRFEEAFEEKHFEMVQAVQWQPDGNKFASIDTGGNLMIWE